MASESIAHEADSEPIRVRGMIVKYTRATIVISMVSSFTYHLGM